MGDGGKGSAPRPLGIDWDKFEENWNEIFGTVGDRGRAMGGDVVSNVANRDTPRGKAGGEESPEREPSK